MDNLLTEITAENFPNPENKQTSRSRKQRAPNKMNSRRPPLRHIIKMSKIKDKKRILKAAREKK